MSEKQLKVILWIAFTALFFGVFCGVSYLISHSIDWTMAIVFFVVLGLLDKKGIGYLVEHYIAKAKEAHKDSAQSKKNTQDK